MLQALEGEISDMGQSQFESRSILVVGATVANLGWLAAIFTDGEIGAPSSTLRARCRGKKAPPMPRPK